MQVASLRPPFLGDSFPSLKRAISLGKYSPISQKYSESLHRVIAHMLKLNPRERMSADELLRSPELASKLALDDDAGTGFQQGHREREKAILELIGTIKVPQQLNKLQCALPKPCYPDLRPNSPSAWTVAEQKQQRKPPPLPPVASALNLLPAGSDQLKENLPPPGTSRSEPGGLLSIDEYFSRRPMAPLPPHTNAGLAPPRPSMGPRKGNNMVPFQPSLEPIPPTSAPQHAPPSDPGRRPPQPPGHDHAPGSAPAARPTGRGAPARHQYSHRVW